jgi:hypothetical protein
VAKLDLAGRRGSLLPFLLFLPFPHLLLPPFFTKMEEGLYEGLHGATNGREGFSPGSPTVGSAADNIN